MGRPKYEILEPAHNSVHYYSCISHVSIHQSMREGHVGIMIIWGFLK